MPEQLDSSDLREEDIKNPGVAYEHSQADLRIVYGFLIMLAIGIAVVFFVLWGFYAYMERSQGSGIRPAPYTISKPPQIPAPMLQPDPVADNNRVQLTERQWLNTYGWVDLGIPFSTSEQVQATPYDSLGQRQVSLMTERTVHIPIDRAMDLLVQRGLPPSETTNPNPAVGPYPGAARQLQDVSEE